MPGTWNSGMARRHEFGGQKLAGKSRFYTMGFYGLRMGNYGIFTGSQKAGFSLKYGNLWEEYGFFYGKNMGFPSFCHPTAKIFERDRRKSRKTPQKGKSSSPNTDSTKYSEQLFEYILHKTPESAFRMFCLLPLWLTSPFQQIGIAPGPIPNYSSIKKEVDRLFTRGTFQGALGATGRNLGLSNV